MIQFIKVQYYKHKLAGIGIQVIGFDGEKVRYKKPDGALRWTSHGGSRASSMAEIYSRHAPAKTITDKFKGVAKDQREKVLAMEALGAQVRISRTTGRSPILRRSLNLTRVWITEARNEGKATQVGGSRRA